MDDGWVALARQQEGVLSRAQLAKLGLDRHYIRTQVRAKRWQRVGPLAVVTHTGPLLRIQQIWAGVLTAGDDAMLCGLSALELAGLKGWGRERDTILVGKSRRVPELPGIVFVESRRDLARWRRKSRGLPLLDPAAAAILWSAYESSERSALGLLAAVIQQRVTGARQLEQAIGDLTPIRRAKPMLQAIADFHGGSQSLAERDVLRLLRAAGVPPPQRQVKRQAPDGRARFTDLEWILADGRTLILEVDGGFHLDAGQWADDIARERELLSTGDVIVMWCTTVELRREPGRIARDILRVVRASGTYLSRSDGRPESVRGSAGAEPAS
ncbi:MAG: hypothetical protein QM655_12285 [Nocardioidaceae bacterium]